MFTKQQIEKAATGMANSYLKRRGRPPVANPLSRLSKEGLNEILLDAHALLEEMESYCKCSVGQTTGNFVEDGKPLCNICGLEQLQ